MILRKQLEIDLKLLPEKQEECEPEMEHFILLLMKMKMDYVKYLQLLEKQVELLLLKQKQSVD